MNRRAFVTGLGAVLAAPLAAEAQQTGKVWRVGVLTMAVAETTAPGSALDRGLQELGYVEGRNLILDRQFAEGRLERLSALAAELVSRKPDVIVPVLNQPIAAVKAVTSSIPIVMSQSLDPVGARFIVSLARPGGNVTGTTINEPEMAGKPLQLFKECLSRLSRVALLWEPQWLGAYYDVAQISARELGITLRSFEVRQPGDVDVSLTRIANERPDGLWAWPTGVLLARYADVVRFATEHRLPAFYPVRYFVERGGLMSYGANIDAVWRQVAGYVDKILKGAKPADLPVEQPTKFEFVINMKTAKALGLTIPPSLLLRADQVIE